MKKKILFISFISLIILSFSIIPFYISYENKNKSNTKDLFKGPDGTKAVVEREVTLVPYLPDDYPDYYAKCLKCNHIWWEQSEVMCDCGNFDNTEVYDRRDWKNSELYKNLPKESLLYADCNRDNMTITIGFRDGTSEKHNYNTLEEFSRDMNILWSGCGSAEYIYHGADQASIPLGDGSAIFEESKPHPKRDIIVFNNTY